MQSSISNLQYGLAIRAFWFVEVMKIFGKPVRITEAYRSKERQAELYGMGRTQPGPVVTRAAPGTSLHELGRAFDFTFLGPGFNAPDDWWELAGQVGEWLGLRWGGRFKGFRDRPHFEI